MQQQKKMKWQESLEVLADYKWHCARCELPGTQSAGIVRDLKNKGCEIETERKYWHVCKEDNTHRRLLKVPATLLY